MNFDLLLGAVALGALVAASACSDTSSARASPETRAVSVRSAACSNVTDGQPQEPLGEAAAAKPKGTGISGRAVIWPSCPAESDERECAQKPLAARIVVLRSTGQRVASLVAAGDGCFQVAVPPGAYVIEAEAEDMLCYPVDITVPVDGYAEVEVRCDTGVR